MISVVLPTYNRMPLLCRAVESVLDQTYRDIELIVVDDCSDDATEDYVRSIDDERVRYHRLQSRSGACVARNVGISLARGSFIAFQDSDDSWRPYKLEKQLAGLVESGSDVCTCRIMRHGFAQNVPVIHPSLPAGPIDRPTLLCSSQVSTQTILARSEVFERELFSPAMKRLQDYEWVIRASKDSRFWLVDEVLVDTYLQNDSLSSSSRDVLLSSFRAILTKHGDLCQEYPEFELAIRSQLHEDGRSGVILEELDSLDSRVDSLDSTDNRSRDRALAQTVREALEELAGCSQIIKYNEQVIADQKEEMTIRDDVIAGFNGYVSQLQEDISRLQQERDGLAGRIKEIESSSSWKAGRALTWIPRHLKTAAQTLRRGVARPNEESSAASCQVLFINGCDLPTLRRYRVLHQREQLELRGISTNEVFYLDACREDADRAAVLVACRCPLTSNVKALIEAAHEQGKRVYFEVDDLVTDTSYTDNLPVVLAMTPEEKAVFDDGVTRNGKTLSLCDGAIVTTERLAEELAKVSPSVLVNRNVASREMVELSEKARLARKAMPSGEDMVTLGYFSGSMTHNADFREIAPSIAAVMSERDNVFLKVVGDLEQPAELAPFSERIIHANRVDWRDLPELIASVDINLAPLEHTLFNEAKSENKWLEAALVGVPTIASDHGAFAHAILDGMTGLLCTGEHAWTSSILSLVDDASLRLEMGERARKWSLANCTSLTAGDALAHYLFPSRTSIDSLVPTSDQDRGNLVDSLLASRGVAPCSGIYSDKPWESVSLERRVKSAHATIADKKRLVLFVYERTCGDDATFRYYGYNAVQRLADSSTWGGTWVFVDELSETRELISLSSAVILIRCRIRPELLELSHLTSSQGIPMAYLLDDYALGRKTASRIIRAVASNPNSVFERAFWTGVTERFRLASELCSCIITPVGYFSELLQKNTSKPTFTIRASINDEQLEIANRISKSRGARADNRLLIAYFSGTASHARDFAQIVQPLVDVLSYNPDIRLLLGGHLDIPELLMPFLSTGQLLLIPRVDYVTLQCLQAAADIVLAPLTIDDFANCKSALKIFEAGAVGTPACASPSASYREAIVDGFTGFLCSTPTEWSTSLMTLARDPKKRSIMGEHARSYALEYYYGNAILEQVEDACTAIASLGPILDTSEVESCLRSKDVNDWDNPFVANIAFA